MSKTLVEIKDVSKIFDKSLPPALNKLSVALPQGHIIGLAGPDGAGKTTLIRLLTGLLLPTEGTISIAGYDTVKNSDIVSMLIGYMPQRFGLYEDLTVMQNLNLYADLKGVPPEERKEIYEKLLSFTGLSPFTDRFAKALSGGMKQKLGLACALLSKPAFLLLDEPSVGVDPISRRELWQMVRSLVNEGITVLWSTSYLDEAQKCDSVILLNEGKMLFYGPPNDLCKRVEGRVFNITSIKGNRRQVLEKVLQKPNVMDGTIQGVDVRVVIKEKKDPPIDISGLDGENSVSVVPAAPRFEDAFIDILGGGPGGISVLAQIMPQIKTHNEKIVEANHLTKKFGSFTAASDINFTVKSGEIFGLLGPNGAGKSTTFKLLCGLLKPTAGKAYVNGLSLEFAPSEARSHIGYMAQKFSLYGNLSVMQNLEFFSGIYNLTGKKRRDIIDEMIRIFSLESYLNENAEMLPLGFKQRLALSCSVMHQPAVLFLDEPTSGVDPITRREFWTHINGLVEKGITVVVTTHFMDEAEYCDRIGLVYQSKMIQMGSPDNLKLLAKTAENPSPTLEDAFIYLIHQYGLENHG